MEDNYFEEGKIECLDCGLCNIGLSGDWKDEGLGRLG